MNRQRPVFAWLVVLCVASTSAWAAQEALPIKPGLWKGSISRKGSERPVRVVLAHDDTAWSGTVDFVSAGAIGVKLEGIDIGGASVAFTAPAAPGKPGFRGTIAEGGTSIAGTFTQGTGDFPFKLAWQGEAPLPLTVVDGAKLQGIWEGRLHLGVIAMRVIFRVARNNDGEFSATLESPEQAPGEIPAGIGFADPKVRFAIAAVDADYEGTLSADGSTLTGTYTQGGLPVLPMVLSKVERVTQLRRPQEPRRPFPYEEVAIAYRNDAAGITFAGTLTKPQGAGPFRAVLLITGSGAQDRDETLNGHKPFLLIADYLTRKGIAVLRVDDRGVGGSGGDQNATSKDFAGDVQAGVRYLASRRDIDAGHIGLIGHSEGGIIAPMVASSPDAGVAFIVLLAGPGVPGDEILYEQSKVLIGASGGTDADVKAARAQQESIVAAVKAGGDVRTMQRKLRALGIPETADGLLSPWYQFFLAYDPRPTLSKVKVPVLALFGERDLQVPPAQNAPAIEAALKSGAAKNHRVLVLPGLNHMFQTSRTGLPAEYADIEETMSPVVLAAIADWVIG